MSEFTYKLENLYNASRSPSTVHVKNTRLRRFFFKYLFQIAMSVFKWTLPEEWDKNYFKYVLYGYGFISILNTNEFGTICQQCAPGGYNLYYRPAYVIVTNPLIRDTLTRYINRDCVLLHLQPDYSSICDLVGYYADQMALASEAMGVNLVNTKSATVFGAENKARAEALKKMYDKMSEGDPAVVVDKNLLAEDGSPSWFPFTQHIKEMYITSDLLSDLRQIEAEFCTKIGLPYANDKRERLINKEVTNNNIQTSALASQWLEILQDDIKKANEMFDLSLSVDWRVDPQKDILDNWTDGKDGDQI